MSQTQMTVATDESPNPWGDLEEALAPVMPSAESLAPADSEESAVTEAEEKGAKPRKGKMAKPPTVDQAAGGRAAAANGYPWRKPKYFNNPLDLLIPHAERIKIHKRTDDGALKYIRDYTLADLDRARDIEHFIQLYLVKKFGEGEYTVTLISAKGDLTRQVPVFVSDPNPPQPGDLSSPVVDRSMSLLESEMKARQDKIDRLEKMVFEQMSQRPREPTMQDKLAEMQAMKKLLGIDDEKKGSDPMQAFMLMQMMQSKQPQGPDPALMSLIQEMKAEMQQLRQAAMAPPMPPPLPPPPDPGAGLAEVLDRVVAATKPQYSIQDLAALLAPKKDENAFSFKDMIAMLPALLPIIKDLTGKEEIRELKDKLEKATQPAPSKGLKEVVEDLMTLQKVAPIMGFAGGAGDSFGSFLNQLISPDTITAIGQLVRDVKSDGATAAPNGQQLDGSEEEEEGEVELEYPDGFEKYLKDVLGAVGKATDDKEGDAPILAESMKMFQFLGKSGGDGWRKMLMQAIKLAKAKKKNDLIGFVENFFEGLTNAGDIDEKSAERVVTAFKRNIDRVMVFLAR